MKKLSLIILKIRIIQVMNIPHAIAAFETLSMVDLILKLILDKRTSNYFITLFAPFMLVVPFASLTDMGAIPGV